MADFLQETFGVATAGVKWDNGQYKFWQSTDPNVVLFCPSAATLAKDSNGRYQALVSVRNGQVGSTGGTGGTDKITGGSAVVTFTTAIQFNQQEFERIQEQWRAEYVGKGGTSKNPRFVALALQKGIARPSIPAEDGAIDPKHDVANIGSAGGSTTYLINLTEVGAQVWADGVKNKLGVPGGIQQEFQYLQYVPPTGATVTLRGRRAFQHLSASLKASYNGFFYGGSAQIDAAWEKMTREGAIEIVYDGTPDPELAKLRDEMVKNFSTQAQKQWFDLLFQPKPDVKPAQAGNSGGLFGGANFALKWRKEEEAIDLSLKIQFRGWTYMPLRLDVPFTELSKLDPSYVREVQLQRQAQAIVKVEPALMEDEDLLQTAAISWSASEGKSPEAPVFGEGGGMQTYIITSPKPNDVKVTYQGKIVYRKPRWPIIELKTTTRTIRDGGSQILINPGQWIGLSRIFMFVREGNKVLSPLKWNEEDSLVVNVSYKGPHLRSPIKASAQMTPIEPLSFYYPLDPNGGAGQATLSAFGVIGEKMVRAKEQPLNTNEEAIAILVDQNGIQIVSEQSVMEESDELAQSLRESMLNAMITTVDVPAESIPETENYQEPEVGNGNGNGSKEVAGTLIAVEYSSANGPALWIDSRGDRKRVRLHTIQEADPFDDEARKQVRVRLDDSGEYAESILVELPR